MDYSLLHKKILIQIIIMIVSCVNVCAQETIDMVEKFGLKNDIVKLEQYVLRKVRERGSYWNEIENLRQVHVFRFVKSNPFYKIKIQDWEDYSFLEHITPKYVEFRETVNGKKIDFWMLIHIWWIKRII